ncbi:MAG TPA: hypothetical protein VGF69_21900 [Thermoanaerobaculia bacterium]
MLLLLATAARAQDALVAGADADRLESGHGGGASLLWLHSRASGTFSAGAAFRTLPGTRWAYGTLGLTHRLTPLTTLNGEASLGGGSDDGGRFRYLLLRGGVTRELLAKRLYGEAEWLQVDVARQQEGLVRLGAMYLPRPRLALRASVYEALFGDSDTTLGTLRADYDFGRITAIGGFSGGTALPVLLQQTGNDAVRVREAFGGVAFDAASRRWTVMLSNLSSGGEDRRRLSVSCRIPLASPTAGGR